MIYNVMKQPVISVYLGTMKDTVTCFGVGLNQLVKEKRGGLLSYAGMSNCGSPEGRMGHVCVVMRAAHDN
jgi:hypothetical protein